jgi:hypothetical protein
MRGDIVRIAVVALVAAGAGLALSADQQTADLTREQVWHFKQSETVTGELQRRDARLQREIDSGKAPAWAGKYYRGDGLGVNVSVSLAPKGGFTFTWTGCLGRYDANYGRISARGDRVTLDFELPNSRESGPGIAPSFVPVRWGERMYLVAVGQAKEFANAVNSGREPCRQFCSEFLLRAGDELIDAAGRPALPPEWRPYLLDRPIVAAFLQTLEMTVKPDAHSTPDFPYSWRRTRIQIAAGREQGVWDGMTFFDAAPDSNGIEYTVVQVGANVSIAVSTELVSGQGEDAAAEMPATLSTRMYRPDTLVLRWPQ